MPHDPTAPHSSHPDNNTAAAVLSAVFERYGRPAPFNDAEDGPCDPQETLLSIGSVRRFYMHEDMQALLDELVFSGAILQRRSPNA